MKLFLKISLFAIVVCLFGVVIATGTSNYKTVNNLNNQLEQTEKKYSGRIDELTSYQQTLVARLNEMQTTISTLQTANTELQTAYDEYKEENTQLVIQLNVDLQEVSDELARLQTSNDIDQQTIATLQEKITELQNSLDANCATISELQATIDAQEATIAELNQTIEDMIADLNSDLNNTDLFKSIIDGTVTEITAEDLAGVTSIRPYAFVCLSKLRSLELPASLEAMSIYSLSSDYIRGENLTNLEELILPHLNFTFYDNRFSDDPVSFYLYSNNVIDIKFKGTFAQWFNIPTYRLAFRFDHRLFINNQLVTDITKDDFDGVTNIRYACFMYNTALKTVYIPQTIITSDGQPFFRNSADFGLIDIYCETSSFNSGWGSGLFDTSLGNRDGSHNVYYNYTYEQYLSATGATA